MLIISNFKVKLNYLKSLSKIEGIQNVTSFTDVGLDDFLRLSISDKSVCTAEKCLKMMQQHKQYTFLKNGMYLNFKNKYFKNGDKTFWKLFVCVSILNAGIVIYSMIQKSIDP
jgi:hypothetical protein